MILKKDMTHQTMKLRDPYQQVKEKMIELMKDELGGKSITEFVGLRPKTYSY